MAAGKPAAAPVGEEPLLFSPTRIAGQAVEIDGVVVKFGSLRERRGYRSCNHTQRGRRENDPGVHEPPRLVGLRFYDQLRWQVNTNDNCRLALRTWEAAEEEGRGGCPR